MRVAVKPNPGETAWPPPLVPELPAPAAPQVHQGQLFDPGKPNVPAPTPSEEYTPPPEQLRLWAEPEWVHISQYEGYSNPNARFDDNANCGPTAAVMALRLLGKDVPGFHGEDTQQVIDAARMLSTGNPDEYQYTYPHEIARVLVAGDARPTRTRSLETVLRSARHNIPAIILGNSTAPGWYDSEFNSPKVAPSYTGHFVVISRYDAKTKRYTLNDPILQGPVYVTEDQIRAFATHKSKSGKQLLSRYAIVADDKPPLVHGG